MRSPCQTSPLGPRITCASFASNARVMKSMSAFAPFTVGGVTVRC